MPEVALAGLRAGAVAVLGLIALSGAAVAGMEKALTAPAVQNGAVATPGAPVDLRGVAGPPGTSTGPPVASAAPLPNVVRPARPPCAPPVRICVQLSGSSAWLLTAKGAVVGPVPVRLGKPDSPTPVGLFPVDSKQANHVNSVTGTSMPFALFFAGDLAMYQAELNQPSAGSVRLPAGPAERFFREASVGDLIEVVP